MLTIILSMIWAGFYDGFKWLSWQFTDKLDANFMVGRRWKWLSWQFTDKLDANLLSVDGESDCRDSFLTNSMQTYGR